MNGLNGFRLSRTARRKECGPYRESLCLRDNDRLPFVRRGAAPQCFAVQIR